MDALDKVVREADAALLIVSFLQADYKSAEYRDELLSLGQEVGHTRAVDLNGCTGASPDIEYVEADGSKISSITFYPLGAQPADPPQRLDAAVIQQVAEELREISAQLEHRIVSEATRNLRKNLLASTFDKWEHHLSSEVSRVLRQNVTLKDISQEYITLALTLTLVKGVCEQTPRLLGNLFRTTLHYVVHSRAR